jgi:hypothetical protein
VSFRSKTFSLSKTLSRKVFLGNLIRLLPGVGVKAGFREGNVDTRLGVGRILKGCYVSERNFC